MPPVPRSRRSVPLATALSALLLALLVALTGCLSAAAGRADPSGPAPVSGGAEPSPSGPRPEPAEEGGS